MAEGGGDDSDNPFSFKKFVKKKDSPSVTDEDKENDDDQGDIFLLPDVSAPKKKGKTTLIVEDGPPPSSSKKKGNENPFSFKKFLSSGSGSKPKAGKHSRVNTPDFASDLPDFVQDHFTDELKIRSESDSPSRDLDLPDFTLASVHQKHQRSNGEFDSDLPCTGVSSIEVSLPSRDEDDTVMAKSTKSSGISSLPDFLSDGAINSSENFNGHQSDEGDSRVISNKSVPGLSHDGANNMASLEVHGHLELENRKLREENQKLRQKLEETEKLTTKEADRVSELLKRMEKQQKKEAEETAVMERAVQQVEANLVTTTKRAVKAENTVTKLKQEVKTLQAKLASVLEASQDNTSTDDALSAIKERTKYTSDQLKSAADTGEQALKQLMSGVDQLRLLSHVLASIDKITDLPEDSQDKSSSGST